MGPTSNASELLTTSANSPDTLPLKGYTVDQLANYIERQLGKPVWNVEITRQQILDCIQDALALFSQWVPIRRPAAIPLTRGLFKYLDGVDVGLGIAEVSFVDLVPLPSDVFYANLLPAALTPLFRTGLDEYDVFLRWRKTWKRVTSIEPDWFYDDYAKALYIHNPIERYSCGIIAYFPYDRTEQLTALGARWVKEYALARAKLLLGEIWAKYSGAVPGPIQNLQLDQQKRDLAQTEITRLLEQLHGIQMSAGVSID